RLPSDGQSPARRPPCVPREQQDQASLPPQPAVPPVLGREREPLGEDASFERGLEAHRQERHRRGPRRDALARRESLRSERTCPAKRSSSNPRPAPATSTRPPRTSARHPTRSRSGSTIRSRGSTSSTRKGSSS